MFIVKESWVQRSAAIGFIAWRSGNAVNREKKFTNVCRKHGEKKRLHGYSTVKRWIQNFEEQGDLHQIRLKDGPRSGRPRSSMTRENIVTVSSFIEEDPRSSLRSLEAATGIPRETVRQILIAELELRKVCSTWIPHDLSQANKELRVNCAKQLRHVLSELGDDAEHVFTVEDES